MGDYIGYEELVLRFPSIKSWNSGDKNQTMVESFMIPYAENRVNAALGMHFSVPFSGAHPTVKDLSFQFCKYYSLMDLDTEKAKSYYDDVLQPWIERLTDGSEKIVTDSGTTLGAGAANEIWSTTKDYHPAHGMLGAENEYTMISSERIDDEENDRGKT
jgi:hypothetical protein